MISKCAQVPKMLHLAIIWPAPNFEAPRSDRQLVRPEAYPGARRCWPKLERCALLEWSGAEYRCRRRIGRTSASIRSVIWRAAVDA
ncbi:hypothetical protein RSAG8_09483, partial [Rhizoctonia solani AG-8 WAC10335]